MGGDSNASRRRGKTTVTFVVPAYGSLYENMLLTKRNGNWYIGGIWSSGSP